MAGRNYRVGEKSGGTFEFLGRFPGNSLSVYRTRSPGGEGEDDERGRRGRAKEGSPGWKWPRRRGAAGATEAQDRPSVTEICETHRALANGASNPIEIAVGRGDSSKGIIRGPPFPRHREERNSKELWILQIEREIEWILISQPVSWRMKLRSGYLI